MAGKPATDRSARIIEGREAAAGGSWAVAYDALTEADQAEPLAPDELEVLGWAAFYTARPDEAVAARQRAFVAVQRSDPTRAGLIAIHIAMGHFGRHAMAVGSGWLLQAERLLADAAESEAGTWLAWLQAVAASEAGETEGALAAAEAVITRAARLGVTDVEALASLLKGQLLTRQGLVDEGARVIDPVMALAVGGLLGPFASSWVYCGTISACSSTGDLERAWEWTTEVGRCGLDGSSEFPGDCRMHRAELLRIRGEWARAEVEMASVFDTLGSWHGGHVATAYYELGELSRHRGDLDAAAEAFARCREHGHAALPGLAALALAEGKADAAAALVESELATTTDAFARARLLPVAVGSLLAAGRLDDARSAAGELRDRADAWSAPLHQARACHADGAVALADEDLPLARRRLTEAVDWWRQASAPYDEAVSQELLGLAAEPAAGTVHLESAVTTFRRLGAVEDTRRVLDRLGRGEEVERVTLALMFTDIEGSTTRLAELGDTAWLKVLRRHDDILRGLFVRYGGDLLTGTGDGFFVGFPTAEAALDCALEIQAAEQDVRVRVGVHLTEACRDPGGLSGRGVHEAARISALGSGGDIVVSQSTLDGAGRPYPVREARTAVLKGLPGEMAVAYLGADEPV